MYARFLNSHPPTFILSSDDNDIPHFVHILCFATFPHWNSSFLKQSELSAFVKRGLLGMYPSDRKLTDACYCRKLDVTIAIILIKSSKPQKRSESDEQLKCGAEAGRCRHCRGIIMKTLLDVRYACPYESRFEHLLQCTLCSVPKNVQSYGRRNDGFSGHGPTTKTSLNDASHCLSSLRCRSLASRSLHPRNSSIHHVI